MRSSVLSVLFFLIIGMGRVAWAEEASNGSDSWASSIGFGFTATGGNSETTNLALTFQAVKTGEKSKWNTDANLTLATTNGDKTADRGGIKSQYDLLPMERLFYFGKIGLEYDKFTKIDLRSSPGAGVGYTILQDEGVNLTASAGANIVTDFFANNTSDTRGTLSISEKFSWDLSQASSLSQDFNIQNNFKDFGDYLLNAELSLSSKVSDRLSLKASLLEKYDSKPFARVLKKNDITFITSLNYTL
jgi:putative salt-induced outer membrane protein YdiY